MKISLLITLCSLILISEGAITQNNYKNERLIFADKDRADILVGKDWQENRWQISPQTL